MIDVTIADFRLELVPESANDVRKHGRGKKTALRRYRVFLGEERVGSVGLEMATFERSAKGLRYVTKRWTSPRWFYKDNGETRHYRRSPRESRKAALEGLAYSINDRRREAAEAIAQNSA